MNVIIKTHLCLFLKIRQSATSFMSLGSLFQQVARKIAAQLLIYISVDSGLFCIVHFCRDELVYV